MDIEQATKELEAIREKELVSIKALLNGKLSHEPTTEE
jgi:hypothetical protein